MHHTNVIARTSFYSQTRQLLTMENAQWPYQPLTAGTNCCWVKFRFHFQDMFASDRWCFIRLYYTHRQAKRHEETNRAGSFVYWTFSPIRRMGSQSNTDGHRWRLFADSIIVYKSKMGSPNIPGKTAYSMEKWWWRKFEHHYPVKIWVVWVVGQTLCCESLTAFYASIDVHPRR